MDMSSKALIDDVRQCASLQKTQELARKPKTAAVQGCDKALVAIECRAVDTVHTSCCVKLLYT